MGARSYLPQLGRFLSSDPISGGSANAYDYGNQDPLNSFDLNGLKPYARAQAGPCTGNLHVWSPKNYGGRGGYGKFYARYKLNCGGNAGVKVTVMKVRRQFIQGPGANENIRAETTKKPAIPDSSHWQGGWGNWAENKKPTSFGCLNGLEYQYTYEIVITWRYATQVGADPNHATLTLSAQEVCGHGRY
jgi:hypothetical protein